ncbi:sensor histidine kinase [Paenibacillaceae bacterium]|nr:sensor histidine kinase [Paenibacillaceae bacterium]
MKLWTKLTSLSIYPKLVLTFLLVLSPLYLISWKMNDSGADTVKKEITESLLSRASLYMGMLEFDFDLVIRLLQEYVNDDDLLTLSSFSEVMNEIEKMQAQVRLKKHLDQLKKSSKFVENVSAFIPAMNRVISSNDNLISAFNEEQFTALSKSTNRFESPFLTWNDRIFISLPYPDPAVSSNRQPIFLLAVEISKPVLAKVLREFTADGGGAVLAGNRVEWAISGSARELDPAILEQNELNRHHEHERTDEASVFEAMLGSEKYMVVGKSSSKLDMSLSMYMPSDKVTSSLASYRSWLYVLSAISIIIVLLFSYSIYRIIHQPLKHLVRSFRRIEQGQFNLAVNYPLKDEFGYLYGQFNAMVKRLDVLVHEVYEQQYRAQNAELRHLQSQINPHFLYNSYFILYRMAMLKDHDNVIYFTKHLGEYFQYITRDGQEEVPLESEVQHTRTYTEIQGVRFGGRIAIDFAELPESARNIAVPRLILQPIVENAYSHGLENKRRNGRIRVAFEESPGQLAIFVEDNGDSLDEKKLREMQAKLQDAGRADQSTGLLNVHRRIQIRYGGAGGLTLQIGEEGGLHVTMIIPREGGASDDPTVNR